MAVSLRKVKDFFLGVDADEYDDEYDDDDYYEEDDQYRKTDIQPISYRSEKPRGSSSIAYQSTQSGNLRSINGSGSSNIVDLHKRTQLFINVPKDIEDAREIIDNTKLGIITVVNLAEVDNALAQRIADFLSGSVDALDGNIRRLSYDMFIIAPTGVEISGEVASEIDEKLKGSSITLPWLSAAFR